jgi:oxaloacetate decarboxylase alpha subunit
MLRDEAGLLTADRLATLLPALRAGLGARRSTCTARASPMSLEAVRLRHRRLDTAFAPLANGTWRCRRSARC